LSAAQIRSLKRCCIGNATASGGLKWQYIAIIATFSSYYYYYYYYVVVVVVVVGGGGILLV